mmetsp:Transcript_30077/g.60242  ORF Transcript_30077/g.60242 Transcript_30077/m.60242 type:complete len:240 (+) Transcript_30077:218-937(+)
MASVSGSEEMACLQSLATRALHAAVVSSGRDVPIVRRILFASRSRDEPSAETKKDLRTNALESLCRGVVHKSVTYNGRWKVQFNKVVAKTHVDVLSDDPDLIRAADSIVNDVRMEAANFLVGLPAILDSTTKSKDHKAHRFLAREGRGFDSAKLGRSARDLERLSGSAAAAPFSAPPVGHLSSASTSAPHEGEEERERDAELRALGSLRGTTLEEILARHSKYVVQSALRTSRAWTVEQ